MRKIRRKNYFRFRRWVLAFAIAAAIAVPTAQARPLGDANNRAVPVVVDKQPRAVAADKSSGFNWTYAWIVAAVAGSLSLSAATVGIARRGRLASS